MNITKQHIDNLSYTVIGCAIEVHKQLGPGLLESVYEKCLEEEFRLRNIAYKKQLIVPINYKGRNLDANLRLDFLIDDLLVVEIKSVDILHPVYEAQLLTYMQLLNKPKGIIINFNCTNIFKEGQKTRVNNFYADLPIA